ncbi:hypothetical protein VP01_11462g1, partial [Puccinia sorghi]
TLSYLLRRILVFVLLWNEILSSCTLALNQIPSHCSKKLPYELFKEALILLSFFKPIGNPVAVISNQKKSKLEPRGDFEKLIGLNAELKSYQIRLDDRRILNSKNDKFLDFSSKNLPTPDYGELLVEPKAEVCQVESNSRNDKEDSNEEDVD